MVKISEIKAKMESEFNKMFIHKAYVQYFYDSEHRESILKPIERIPLVLRIKSLQESFILRKPDYYLNGKPVFKLIRGYPLSIESKFLQTTEKAELELILNTNIEKTLLEVKNTLHYANDSHLILQMKELPKIKMKEVKSQDSFGNEITLYEPDKRVNGKIHIRTNILEKRDLEKNSSFELDTWLQTSYNNVLLKKKMIDVQIIMLWIMTMMLSALGTWIIADNYFEGYYRAKFKGNIIIPIIYKIGLILCQMIIYLMI